MQITIGQAEIEEAVIAHIKSLGLSFGTKTPEVTLTAGRGPAGMTASIELDNLRKVQLGPAEVEVLDKPKEKLEDFTPEVVAPKAKPKKKAAESKKTKTEDGPKKVKPETVKEAVEEPDEDGQPLFGEGNETDDLVEEGEDKLTADSLFGS